MNVFSIFEEGFVHFQCWSYCSSAVADLLQKLVSRISGSALPRRSPDDPADMIDPKKIFRKTGPSCRCVDGILRQNGQRLRQMSMEIRRLGCGVDNDGIGGSGVVL